MDNDTQDREIVADECEDLTDRELDLAETAGLAEISVPLATAIDAVEEIVRKADQTIELGRKLKKTGKALRYVFDRRRRARTAPENEDQWIEGWIDRLNERFDSTMNVESALQELQDFYTKGE